jgi:hypothetical protein
MRKRTLILAVSALAVSVGVASVAWAALPVNQVVAGKIIPKKHPKKKFTKSKLNILTDAQSGANIPPGASRARVHFDNDIKFSPRAAGRCDPAKIAGKKTNAARAVCRGAVVGLGDAIAYLGQPGTPKSGGVQFPVEVTAFNGTPASTGQPRVLLHSDPGFTDPVTLIGVLKKSGKGRDFGRMLDVAVPDGGFILARFHVVIGKVRNPTLATARVVAGPFVKARCKDRNRKLNFFGLFDYGLTGIAPNNYPSSDSGRSFSRCKVKRIRRR